MISASHVSKFFLPLIRTSLSTIQEQTEYIRSHWKRGQFQNIIVTSRWLHLSWVLRWLQLSILPFLAHTHFSHSNHEGCFFFFFPLSFFHFVFLVLFFIILNRWGCSQMVVKLKVPEGAFFYLFVSWYSAPSNDLWQPCHRKRRQVHPIKGSFKINGEPSMAF